jgi:NAD(P)-dependent dehydrogenase (short-subunit alcohol dehydrogenase family)
MLKDKIIVITGGAGLLGQVFVRGIAEHGGTAILADIKDPSKKFDLKSLEKDVSGAIEIASLDITNKESVITLISELTAKYGHIDAVVNNAFPRNKNYGRKLEDISYEDFCEDINMHLGGYFLVAQQFCRAFQQQGHGNIINISSIYGVMPPRFEVYDGTSMTSPVEYSASKSAIIHLTRYFAK